MVSQGGIPMKKFISIILILLFIITSYPVNAAIKSQSSTISKIENGHNIIATPFLYQICKKYNISADYLLGKIDSPKYLN